MHSIPTLTLHPLGWLSHNKDRAPDRRLMSIEIRCYELASGCALSDQLGVERKARGTLYETELEMECTSTKIKHKKEAEGKN